MALNELYMNLSLNVVIDIVVLLLVHQGLRNHDTGLSHGSHSRYLTNIQGIKAVVDLFYLGGKKSCGKILASQNRNKSL